MDDEAELQQQATFAAIEAELAKRWPESRVDPSLARIEQLVDLIGSPQQAYQVIHVTGTNGKTSTARMIDQLLRAHGLRTGLLTSPHLHLVTERIRLDGEPISDQRFIEAYEDIAAYLNIVDAKNPDTALSYFEALTALGFAALADAPVEVAVVEVGLGGTWDATNVASGSVAVVTPIGLDHQDYLGETLVEIAEEKAGIIKPGATAILAAQEPEVAPVLLRRAAAVGAQVAREGLEFGVLERRVAVGGQLVTLKGLGGVYEDVFLPLFGGFQAQNAACALAAVEAFFGIDRDKRPLNGDIVREALGTVSSPGRLEIVRRDPTILVDSAHNPPGIAATVEAVRDSFAFRRLIGVTAILRDKDAESILRQLEPLIDEVVMTENSSPRSFSVEDLARLAVSIFGEHRVHVQPRFTDALDTAIQLAQAAATEPEPGGVGVLVTGSVVTAGNAREVLIHGRT